jgi:3-oxoacyl-[acyl-carrier-protein] synthase-3
MGTKIEMVSVTEPWFNFLPRNSIELTARVARKCINEARINVNDLGLLINTGIYRYKNFGEPAIAALIQKKIGANTNNDTESNRTGKTFSFDLNNGGCGWLTGIQILQELMISKKINYGMVVTGDAEPFYGLSENFNFKTAAAAIILSRSNDSEGFTQFKTYSYPDHPEELTSSINYNNHMQKSKRKNILYVRQKDTYPDLCAMYACESLNNFMYESGLKIKDIDMIIASQSPDGFIRKVKKIIGSNDKFIEYQKNGKKMLHTAGPAFALKQAWFDNRFKSSKHIIFLTVGSGINVSVAHYFNQN